MGGVDVAILSCCLRVVFDRLASPILKQFQYQYCSAREDLNKLGSMLSKMQAVLNDAEQKHMTNALVKEWLVDVKDLVYDAQDVLDLCATYIGRRNQVCNNSSSPHTSSTSTCVNNLKKFDIEPWLKEIIQKSEDLAKQMDDLYLKVDVVGGPNTNKIGARGRKTSSHVDESRIYGRDSDKNKIIELLLSEGPIDEVGVLPIVGMGGLGKTTLAQLVYKDQRIVEHFDLKAWVCVSDQVDIEKITKAIVESFTKAACNLECLDTLQGRLIDTLNGKRFLIVLDDIWNENPDDWEDLKIPFSVGMQGSKILVTTRNEVVSKIVGTISSYSLGVLSNKDCWSLFWQRTAVDDKDLSAHPNLEAIGREIVEKCKGLPLAAKTLGSLLRFNVEEDKWKDVLKTDIWDMPEGENIILPILRLSYQHLPSHLKQCFAYCSIFPKDYRFQKDELVLLWMAEGFVQSSSWKQMEDIGSSYFDDLFSRSFFQYSSDYDKTWFVMHDLIHDLAQSISRETCVSLDGDKLCNISEKARYSSLVYVRRNRPVGFDAFYDAKRLRTFLLRFPYFQFDHVIQKFPHDLFPAWRCLHVLSLRNLHIIELPDSIGNLQLLRYLDLYGTHISKLPESVCTLYNLQTLILGRYITKLPLSLCNLINLRHIIIGGLKRMPRGIGTLTNLQTLSDFVVRKTDKSASTKKKKKSDKFAELGELKDLIHLRGKLCITGLENVVDVMNAKEANLENKQHLCELTFEWFDNWDMDSGEEKRVEPEKIIECLQPHKNLKVLRIDFYPGVRFPSWISMLSSLVNLELHSATIEVLPPLGKLPFLKHLDMEYMDYVRKVGCEFFGDGIVKGFPSLETLVINHMAEWEEWSSRVEDSQEDKEVEHLFPHLAYLTIKECPKLSGFPFYRLPSLVELDIYKCAKLTTLPRFRIPLHFCGDGKEFPCLRELRIDSCHKLRKFPRLLPSLVDLRITSCRQLGALPRLPLLRHLELHGCDGKTLFTRVGPLLSLSSLVISQIRRLKCLTMEFLQPLTTLEELRIIACKDLKTLGSEVVGLHHLASLQQMTIHGCGKLVLSFPKEKKELPTNLQCLSLKFINKHGILHQLHNLTSLVELEIRMAPWLASFPDMELPPKLRKLEIGECKSLKSLPKGLCNLTCLEELKIDRCPSLTSFTTTQDDKDGLFSFPPTLEILHVESCRNLKVLFTHEWIHHNLITLRDSTTKRSHTTIALKYIWFENCKSLESLPPQMQKLTSLEILSIMRCPRIVTFPEGGWPTKLRELEIGGCGDYFDNLPKCVWLQKLTCLEKLTLSWCSGMVSFPKEEDEWQMPPILRELSFNHFKNLVFFRSKSLQNLTSLQKLHILHAPKLASLPREGLPATIQYLEIRNCPLLKESCLGEKGRDWPKIAHIPEIRILEEKDGAPWIRSHI